MCIRDSCHITSGICFGLTEIKLWGCFIIVCMKCLVFREIKRYVLNLKTILLLIKTVKFICETPLIFCIYSNIPSTVLINLCFLGRYSLMLCIQEGGLYLWLYFVDYIFYSSCYWRFSCGGGVQWDNYDQYWTKNLQLLVFWVCFY